MILTSSSTEKETKKAVKDILDEIRPGERKLSLLIIFLSSQHCIDTVAKELSKLNILNVLACTTAGEISEKGNCS